MLPRSQFALQHVPTSSCRWASNKVIVALTKARAWEGVCTGSVAGMSWAARGHSLMRQPSCPTHVPCSGGMRLEVTSAQQLPSGYLIHSLAHCLLMLLLLSICVTGFNLKSILLA